VFWIVENGAVKSYSKELWKKTFMEERECDCTLIIQESSNNKTINLKCMLILSLKIIPEI